MILYVFRHGRALSVEEAGISTDAERPLSPQGVAEVRLAAEHLRAQGGRPEKIFSSPLRRARETAQVAAAILNFQEPIVELGILSGGVSGAQLWESLEPELSSCREAVIVGHQPQLGEWVALFLGLQTPRLAAGGLVAMEISEEAQAKFLWSRNP
ncbi:MAG: histidine phosphatase family protein [Elusimicrobia bacterium]|nr:histidine phosphatase family protein [Elusimicrobiota bacterium]